MGVHKQYYTKWDETVEALIQYGTLITNIGNWRIQDAEAHMNSVLQKDSKFKNYRHLYIQFLEEMDYSYDNETVVKMTLIVQAQNNREAKLLLDKEW